MSSARSCTKNAFAYIKQDFVDDFYDNPFGIYVEGEKVWDDRSAGESPEDCIWGRKVGPVANQFAKRHFRIAALVMLEQTVEKEQGVWSIMKQISSYAVSPHIRETIQTSELFCYHVLCTGLCMTSGYPVLNLLERVLRSSLLNCPQYETLKTRLQERKKKIKKFEVVPFSRLYERLNVLSLPDVMKPEDNSAAWWSHALRDEEDFHRAMKNLKQGERVQVSVDLDGWMVVVDPDQDQFME